MKYWQEKKPEAITEKWVTDEVFNEAVRKYVPEQGRVLDYGCGHGWALFEIANTISIERGLGIDPSVNGIEYANQCRCLSNEENLLFKVGNQSILENMEECFDTVVSFNVIDVLPDETVHSILQGIQKSLKKGGFFILGINPDYPFDFLEELGYSRMEGYLYKDGILRGNEKTKEEWIHLLTTYFEFVEYNEFALEEREKQYPRRMIILRKR